MKQCLLKAMLIALLVTITAFAWSQSIFWQDTFDANNGWTVEPNWSITGGQLVLNWSPQAENYNMSATSPNITVPAGAGDLVINQYVDEYAGQGTTVPETFEISVVIGGTPTVMWTYSTDADWGVTGGQDLILPLAAYSGQTIQLRFRSFGDSTYNFDYWRIFGITAYANLSADMAALTITGSTTPTQGTATNYVVTVKNNGTTTATTYTVKLMNNTIELGSQAGTNLAPNATQTHTYSWTPNTPGAATLTGTVIFNGDANLNNNTTAPLNVIVQPAGISAVTIGDGSASGRVPVDMYYKNSLYENIYYQDELGFASGSISSVAFYNNFTTNLPAKPIKIWLGSTTNNDLSAGWIPSTQLTLVFDGVVDFPIGPNTITIPFTTPYNYPGGNLVMMVNRPMDTAYFASTDVFLAQTIGTNRSRNIYNDTTVYDPAAPPATSTLSGLFPKTTFFYTGTAVTTDLGVVSLTGNTTPSVGTVWNYNVSIRNNGSVAQNTYQVKLYKEGNVELSSVAGTTIAPLQTLQFSLPWTPATAGATYIYAKVILAGDQIAVNDQSPNYSVEVQEAGVVAVTVGTGGSVGKYPLDMFYKASLSETVYLASELNIGGLLTGIQYYNNFVTDLPNKPTKIWAGETQLTDLSTGWIPSTALTLVYDGTVNYPLGQNNITIPFTTPLPYGGGNLAIMVERPLDAVYYSSSDNFVTQTVGTNRTLKVQSDTIVYDPAVPPAATPTGMFPKTTFFFITQGMGALNGTVTVNGTPLAGATVTVANSSLSYTTGANGTYSFPYVAVGTRQVSATKHGYNTLTYQVSITENQTTTRNFALSLLPQVNVTGRIVGSDAPTVGIAGATIALSGYEPYTTTTNSTGYFTIAGVYASQTYSYLVSAAGYQNATGQIVVGTSNLNMGNITINESMLPVNNVIATEAANLSNVVVTWNEPGQGGGEWIHYDSGENDDSIGTGSAADFDVAIRYPVSALAGYAGMSLYSLKVWPAQAGTFSLRVWTGGTALAPATMVVDQAFTPTLNTYNTIMLNTPVPITGTEELWFGYRCNVTTGFPAGVDAGPAINGFGNMIYWQGAWTTLTTLSATLDYNWNIQGYVGYSAPTRGTKLKPLAFNSNRINSGILTTSGIISPKKQNLASRSESADRARIGYKVWRLNAGQETNEATWTSLTANPISPASYQDMGWGALPDGTYRWAVKAVYTGGALSIPALSNPINRLTQIGTIAGVVRNQQNQAIQGATVSSGAYTATTNTSGLYSMTVPAGTYVVNASHPSYETGAQSGVVVQTGQTTTVNFVLAPTQNMLADGFETYPDFALTFAPWTCVDVDLSSTYGIVNVTYPNSGAAMAYIIFNPSATTPAITTIATHGGAKMAACFASTTPPNNDWLITPQVTGASQLKFWARSYVADYGLERFKVGVSTTGTSPATFTIISGANHIQAPITWTEYTYDLSAYGDTPIRVGIQCISNDAFIFFVDDVTLTGAVPQDPFGTPTVLPTSMSVMAGVTIGGVPASNGDVLAAYVNVGGTPQLRGKQTIQVIGGVAGCMLQVYTESNGESISFKVWDASASEVIPSVTTLASIVNGTVGSLENPYMINAASSITQTISLLSGWNLVSLNVSPADHSVTSIIASIAANVQQIKGTEGVYIPNNPFSTLTSLTDGKAYTIMMTSAASWSVTGSPIAASTPLALLDGWNMVAYLPQSALPVATAIQSIVTWLEQVKGTDGVYIPNNPFSTLTTMSPNKGYWIKLSGAHNLIYPAGSKSEESICESSLDIPVTILSSSMAVLAKCDAADVGDILLARVNGELRGAEKFIASGGNTAVLIQIYTETAGEEIVFSILKPDNTELALSTTLSSQPQETIGTYPNFMILEQKAGEELVTIPTRLNGCYPNPFNPSTTISFSVAQDNIPVSIEIYNIKGQKISSLLNSQLPKGNHSIVWNGKDDKNHSVASGVYFFKMSADGYNKTIKALLSK